MSDEAIKEAWDRAGEPLNDFIQCPECGSDDGPTLEVAPDHQFDDGGRRVAIKGVCAECDHETPWLPIARSEVALFERVNGSLYR